MPIKEYKPTTPGRRKASVITRPELTKKRPEKSLITIKKRKGGRTKGRITVRHRGGGAKRFIRIIDFKRQKFDQPATVIALEYDPNRSAHIALLKYEDGTKSYMIAPVNLKVNDVIVASKKKVDIKPGNRMPLERIPVGISVYNVELIPGQGGLLARGAGTTIQFMAVEGKYAQLKLPSSEIRLVPKECMATIGQSSVPEHRHRRLGKAGIKRHLGIRPTVRGKVMNPVDHPHGGGEGRNPIGLKYPKTPWGKHALGVKTRRKNRKSEKLILTRRKKKRR